MDRLGLITGKEAHGASSTQLDRKFHLGYEISFTRYFYKPQPMRTLEEISADILAVKRESEGLLDDLLKGGT